MYYWDSEKGPCERVALRVWAVRWVIGGQRKSEVARRLGITRQTLDSWMARHQQGGMEALAARPRGRTKNGGSDRAYGAAGATAGD
jgi:transposase-like protein